MDSLQISQSILFGAGLIGFSIAASMAVIAIKLDRIITLLEGMK